MDEDTPDDRVFTLLADALFPGHPLGREVAGTRASIEAMTRAQIAGFHEHWYRPANIVVSAAGAVEHAEVVEGVVKRFSGVDGGARPARATPRRKARPLAVLRRRAEQVHVAIGVRGLSLHDPDRWALDVADHILGGGPSSRLFRTVREERGLAYSVFSATSEWVDCGQLSVYAGTAPTRFQEVFELLHAELDRYAADGPSDAELHLAKSYIDGALQLETESVAGRMGSNGRAMLNHDRVETLDEALAHYRAVTVDDVRRVLGRVLVDAPRSVAVVGPIRKADVARR